MGPLEIILIAPIAALAVGIVSLVFALFCTSVLRIVMPTWSEAVVMKAAISAFPLSMIGLLIYMGFDFSVDPMRDAERFGVVFFVLWTAITVFIVWPISYSICRRILRIGPRGSE